MEPKRCTVCLGEKFVPTYGTWLVPGDTEPCPHCGGSGEEPEPDVWEYLGICPICQQNNPDCSVCKGTKYIAKELFKKLRKEFPCTVCGGRGELPDAAWARGSRSCHRCHGSRIEPRERLNVSGPMEDGEAGAFGYGYDEVAGGEW